MQAPRIDVVGLGPAGPELLTQATLELIESIEHRFVRTQRHPAASAVAATGFDHHYESESSFDAVYRSIVDELWVQSRRHGHVLYAVPGSPRVAEHTVELLCSECPDDVEVVVHPALSFLDLTWVALGVDPLQGVRIVDGHEFGAAIAGERGPVLVAQCHSAQVLSDIKLAVDDPESELMVTVLQRLGLPDERVFDVAWNDLDRSVEADHLTSLFIPRLPADVAAAFAQFDEMVRRLRQDCPWDAEQTHASLRRYLLEESYETLEALDQLIAAEASGGDLEQAYTDVCEELGDLLYQVFFHSILATEQGWFTVAEVAEGIHNKLYERHPHVYGEVETSLEDLPAQWEKQKRTEKGRASVMDGIPAALPALVYATKVQKKAIAIGHDLGSPGTALQADGEAEMGRLLFDVVALARSLGVDPESALRQHAVARADEVRATEV